MSSSGKANGKASAGGNFVADEKSASAQQRLRHKLRNDNEMNPLVDCVLQLVIFIMVPFIYLFSLIHDKLMFNFLNNTYIYNVSWEVIAIRTF